jgi:hypothetical protein
VRIFREPHTDYEIGLGTLAEREYIDGFHEPKIGSAGRAMVPFHESLQTRPTIRAWLA